MGKVTFKLHPKSTNHKARNAGFNHIKDFCSERTLYTKLTDGELICKRCFKCLKRQGVDIETIHGTPANQQGKEPEQGKRAKDMSRQFPEGESKWLSRCEEMFRGKRHQRHFTAMPFHTHQAGQNESRTVLSLVNYWWGLQPLWRTV